MKNKIDLFRFLKDQGELTKIFVYTGTAVVLDPYKKNTQETLNSVIPVEAIVSDASFGSLAYEFYGSIPTGSKKIIAPKIYKGLFECARKILIDEVEYITYKSASKGFQIRTERDYIIVVATRA
jgi:hypothetical protein